MKVKSAIFFFFLYMTLSSCLLYGQTEVESELWQTKKSTHFIAYFQEAPTGYIDELIEQAENYYNGILENLGFRRFDFWTWEERAKIYLFKDFPDYQADTKRFAWSGATVNVEERTIKTFIGQLGFFDSILPHEMAHIIFREFVGERQGLPLWLDEGVACAQEQSTLNARLQIAQDLVEQNKYIGLERLSRINDPFLINPQNFYAQSTALVIFLLKQYGKDKFLDFSRRLRDTANWQEALLGTYQFSNLNEFEQKWKDFMVQ